MDNNLCHNSGPKKMVEKDMEPPKCDNKISIPEMSGLTVKQKRMMVERHPILTSFQGNA